MKRLNCIVVFDKGKEHILFCRRMKDPCKDLYNFVGGKVEPGEDSSDAAYRELYEETGIRRSDIHLSHFMDLTYYQSVMGHSNIQTTMDIYAEATNEKKTEPFKDLTTKYKLF